MSDQASRRKEDSDVSAEETIRVHGGLPLVQPTVDPRSSDVTMQVHPSDEVAQRYETEGVGKMEAWYILSAPKGCRVIRGVLPGTTIAEFRQQLGRGSVEQCLNVMDVKLGGRTVRWK